MATEALANTPTHGAHLIERLGKEPNQDLRRQRLNDHAEEMLHFLGLIADELASGESIVIRPNNWMGRKIKRIVETVDVS